MDWKRIALGVLLAVVTVMGAGCVDRGASEETRQRDETGPIKVGAILSLTGQNAALGTAEKRAFDLEVARINDAGGIGGRPIDLIVEDDGTDEAKAQAAAVKLIDQDQVVAILGASGTGQSMAIRGDVDRAGIPQIALAGGSIVTDQFDSLVFQTPWPNRIVVPFMLQSMKDVGIVNVGLLTDNGGYGKDGRSVITSQVADFGMEIVADETFSPQDTDVSAQLTKIRGSGADAILLWTAGKDAVTVVKNREQLHVQQPLFGASGQARSEFIEGAGTAGEGVIIGTGASFVPDIGLKKDSKQYKVVTEFSERYEKKYKEQPDIFAGHAYDAINILADSIRRARTTEPKALRDAIEKTSKFVGFGGSFSFSTVDHNGLTEQDLFLYQVESGKWVGAL